MVILLTVLAFLLVTLMDIKKRQKESENSPEQWSLEFFWKDNKYKLPVSLSISIILAVMFYLTVVVDGEPWYKLQVNENISISLNLKYFVYIIIGAVPELVLQFLKDKFNFLQPKEVTVVENGELTTYQRR